VAHLKHGRTQNSCFVICLRLLLVRHQSQQKSRYLLDGAQRLGRDWPISSCGRSIRRVAAQHERYRTAVEVRRALSRAACPAPGVCVGIFSNATCRGGKRPQTWPARIAGPWSGPFCPLNLWPSRVCSTSGISGPRRVPAIRYFRVILLRHNWSCKFGAGASLAKFGGASGLPKALQVSLRLEHRWLNFQGLAPKLHTISTLLTYIAPRWPIAYHSSRDAYPPHLIL
jgi:hypothetical protein